MKLKKLSTVLATILALGTFAGCGGQIPAYDESKTTVIFVNNYDCGYGRTHVSEIAKRFMEATKDISYEEGKMGVYVDVYDTQDNATGDSLVNSLAKSSKEVFFTSNVDTPMLKQSGQVMDLQEIINATSANKDYKFASETSIKDRMFDDFRDYVVNENGSCYMLPLFIASFHLYYDAELLKSKSLYIAEGSTDTELDFTNDEEEFNAGPDGKHGTYDDGMPQTYAQFYLWCNKMKEKGVIPISYSGLYNQHMTYALNQFWADYEGKDNTRMWSTFTGSATDLVNEVNADGIVKSYYEPTTIRAENAYMLSRQEGRLRVLELAKKIADNNNDWVHPYSFATSESHTMAQITYLSSKYSQKSICMFAEGSYWEAEAKSVFEQYQSKKGGRLDRQFKVLPSPKAKREQVGTDTNPARTTTWVSDGLQMIVKKGISESKMKAIKDFIVFYNNEENMAIENVEAGVPKPYTYTITDELKANMSTYNKSLYQYLHDENNDVVLSKANNSMFYANTADFDQEKWGFTTLYGKDSVDYRTVNVFIGRDDSNDPMSAVDYFNGMYKYLTYSAVPGSIETRWYKMFQNTKA